LKDFLYPIIKLTSCANISRSVPTEITTIKSSIIANYATVTFSRWCSTEFKSSET
jgi:hypothetical protein